MQRVFARRYSTLGRGMAAPGAQHERQQACMHVGACTSISWGCAIGFSEVCARECKSAGRQAKGRQGGGREGTRVRVGCGGGAGQKWE